MAAFEATTKDIYTLSTILYLTLAGRLRLETIPGMYLGYLGGLSDELHIVSYENFQQNLVES